ncbi:AurF N-oxygenase family protein [Actinomadura rudentiformis]|uniref:Diiron oxygenase n=1 Tax=Actinomadura rudentiformis TaxID=359158 RepID=A0A6H9YKD1_9ACTN|nr:diiron oxygenase [Actinomadura rudentiformis]KAB2346807.1 diiron oxygenase [Actinomadura rudentiformis]
MPRAQVIDIDEARTRDAEDVLYEKTLRRLSKASVEKHWEPYTDIPWDDLDFEIDPDDPRWVLPKMDPLGAHPWYRAQPEHVQARIGLWRQAQVCKVGMQFENVLKRGLLTYAFRLPNDSAEFRYVYHETIEEGHHGMMFQEFVNRSEAPVEGMPLAVRVLAEIVPPLSLVAPSLFFFWVLAGEEPIDYVQRRMLRDGSARHPLLNKIISIHVAEEARHISFARQFLKHRVPRMPAPQKFVLSLVVPPSMKLGVLLILTPPVAMARRFQIPDQVMKETYWATEPSQDLISRAVSNVRGLCSEIGLINPVSKQVWRLLNIWEDGKG